MALLERWASTLEANEGQCFWPGPRPMTDPARAAQLIGREDEAYDFSDRVREFRLVVLSGETGVGKSSMLQLGIRPQLQRDGFLVVTCTTWPNPGELDGLDESEVLDTVERLFSRTVREQLPFELDADEGVAPALHRRYPESGVIILDQFEELIRNQPRLYDAVLRWIEHVVKRYRVHVVISLRTEFEHRLRDLRVGPFTRKDFYLSPLRATETIAQIIRSAQRHDGLEAPAIEEGDGDADGAVGRILELWATEEGGRNWSGVGLLHLQALLYILWRTRQGHTVTRSDVERAESRLAERYPSDSLLGAALAEAVSLRLEQCALALHEVSSHDRALIDGVVEQIVRMTRHLSSGGYKVDHERRELAELVLESELSLLDTADPTGELAAQARGIFDHFARETGVSDGWLDCSRTVLVPNGLHEFIASDRGDPHELSAGPLLGMPPLAVAVEEFRRFFFALAWLDRSSIIRQGAGEDTEARLSLIHDGFARGLRTWADKHGRQPAQALTRLSTSVGVVMQWEHESALAEPTGDSETRRIVPNLRWRACRVVKATWRHVTFVNCDLRETHFVDCTFEGVTFVNCLLDGVSFHKSTILGMPAAPEEMQGAHRDRLLPSFVLETPQTVAVLDKYLEQNSDTPYLASWTSGRPAQPSSDALRASLSESRLDDFRLEREAPQRGGLVFYGGRVSSLMFIDTAFNEGGVSLRHVAGTSLDFVEQRGGSIELFDVAIRGFSVSPPVAVSAGGRGGSHAATPPRRAPLTVAVIDSILQNAWFSVPLLGAATITNTVIWQLFNGNARNAEGFTVTVDESPNLSTVNATKGPGSAVLDPDDFLAVDEPRGDVLTLASRIDYQSLHRLLQSLPPVPEE